MKTSFEHEPAYVNWYEPPFPKAATPSTELNAWHKDMLVADMWVAEALIPFARRSVHSPVVPDVFAEIRRLRNELERIVSEGLADDDLARVPSYRHYLDLLEAAYQRFLDYAPA